MSTVTRTPGRFVWRELMTGDVERAKGFYGELFGWTFKDFPMGPGQPPYPIAHVGGKGIGGLVEKPDPTMPSFWAAYVSTGDVDGAVAAAIERGGAVAFGPMDVPEVGRMAMIMDFDQAAVALLQAARGDGPAARPGLGEFCWETLTSSDPERAKAFYQAVCGWQIQPSPVGGAVFAVGPGMEDTVADLQRAAGMPAMWLSYVVVESIEAMRDRALRLGGRVVVPLIELPPIGRIAVIADPTGGHVGLFQGLAG